ncbi:MAG: MBL fold metallo-hydrolase [Candidatus Atribacteria bacterium]|nr:MAG: MBL fold metallo-hydrolase [Candidatus Atribacteria bacterium]
MNESVLRLAFRMVNAYLVRTGDEFILIDTGFRSNRKALDAALIGAGCGVGDLKLIVITHGDANHAGNTAFLRHPQEAQTPPGSGFVQSPEGR